VVVNSIGVLSEYYATLEFCEKVYELPELYRNDKFLDA
jgi:hypothetical protein